MSVIIKVDHDENNLILFSQLLQFDRMYLLGGELCLLVQYIHSECLDDETPIYSALYQQCRYPYYWERIY